MVSLKNQYLKEMGVDVWVPRQRNPFILAPPPARDSQTSPPQPAKGQDTGPDGPGDTVASRAAAQPFHLCFMTYRDVSLVFSVPLGVQALPGALRRFADDLAFACLGHRVKPVIANLRWPMVQSAHIDQSEEAARAVVQQRLSQCGRRLLLFGEQTVAFEADHDGAVLRLDEIESYQAVPLNKRALWRSIDQFRGKVSA